MLAILARILTLRRSAALLAATVATGLALAAVPRGDAQPPLRIGVTVSRTGQYADLAQNRLRAYQLCVRDANDKGGVLGRTIELIAEDDQSDPRVAARIYERLVTQDKVDALFGPYSTPITDAVADVAEKYRMPLFSMASTTSIFQKGRDYLFMVSAPSEASFEGLMTMAAKRGLKTVTVLHENSPFPKAVADGAVEWAEKRGLRVVQLLPYPKSNPDFAAILTKVSDAKPDVLVAATYFDDAVAIVREMRRASLDVKMLGVTEGGDLPRFHATLGKDADFVYVASPWVPELVTLRTGGSGVSRQYPGAREFMEAYLREFPGADLSYHPATGYAGCQVLLEVIKRANSLDGPTIKREIVRLDINTVVGRFRVDARGVQVTTRMLIFQWQDGKKAVVWPDELALGQPRFPTPPWSQR